MPLWPEVFFCMKLEQYLKIITLLNSSIWPQNNIIEQNKEHGYSIKSPLFIEIHKQLKNNKTYPRNWVWGLGRTIGGMKIVVGVWSNVLEGIFPIIFGPCICTCLMLVDVCACTVPNKLHSIQYIWHLTYWWPTVVVPKVLIEKISKLPPSFPHKINSMKLLIRGSSLKLKESNFGIASQIVCSSSKWSNITSLP